MIIAKIAPSVPAQSKVGTEDERAAWEERKRLLSEAEAAAAAMEEKKREEERLKHQAEKLRWAKSMGQVMASAKKMEARAMNDAMRDARKAALEKQKSQADIMKMIDEEKEQVKRASEEAQRMLDEANAEQALLLERLRNEQASLASFSKKAKLKRQATTLASHFGSKLKEKKHELDLAKLRKEAERMAAEQAGSAAERAAAETYAKAQQEFEEAAAKAQAEAEHEMALYKEKAMPILRREELEKTISKLSTSDLIERLRISVSSRQSDAAEVCAARVHEVTKARPPPPGAGLSNPRADVIKAGGLSVLSACISYAIDQASERGGGHPGKLLDDCAEAVGYCVKQPGVASSAIEAGVLKALAKTLNCTMTSGLKAVEAMCKDADESVQNEAKKSGIQPEWINPPQKKKK